MSKVIERIACPVCVSEGHDSEGNNLTRFADGAYACAANKDHTKLVVKLRPDLATQNGESKSKRPISNPRASKQEKLGPVVAKYPYHDKDGKPVFEIWRHDPKTFRPYRIENGKPILGMGKVDPLPYRLPLVIRADKIIVAEGERDVETLEALGYVATTNPFGAEKWEASWAHYFTGKEIFLCGDNDDPGRRHMDQVAATLLPVAKSIRCIQIPAPAKDITDYLGSLSDNDTDVEARAAVEELLRQPDPLDALLDARRFDLANPPPPARSIYRIGNATIATPGNLCVIAAQAKAGKSALVGAFIAAATGMVGDTLGIVSGNADGGALIHVDSEQSPADHHAIVATALRRVRADVQPPWLRSYRLADVSTKERVQLLQHELDRARADHGGIHSVLLDGVADLVADPNDSAESFALVERLHRLAVTYDTNVVAVLHFNPGTEFNKSRGHLGSQLERKAETNLALEKADGVTVVYTKMARHAHIEKDAGARFQWDAEAGMHLSCGTVQDEQAKADDFTMQAVVDEVFTGRGSLRYSELVSEVMRIKKVKDKTAEKTIAKMVPRYVLKTPFGYSKV